MCVYLKAALRLKRQSSRLEALMTQLMGPRVFCLPELSLSTCRTLDARQAGQFKVHVPLSRSSPMISESPNSSSPLSRKSLSRTRQLDSHADPASESTEAKKHTQAGSWFCLLVSDQKKKSYTFCWEIKKRGWTEWRRWTGSETAEW